MTFKILYSSRRRRDGRRVPGGFPLGVATLLGTTSTLAAPTGGAVTSGAATIGHSGQDTNVDQTSEKASINWQGFSVAPTETVNFHQPSASSITLNRVVGNEKSVIEGALNANGQVFLINSNGVLFTQGSQVNVGGLIASTLDLSDEDFLAGSYAFKGSGTNSSVRNVGSLHASDGGYIALLGKQVGNEGTIIATKGTVALASGDQITLNFNGNSLLSVAVGQGTLDALVENKQAIYADGGTIILRAKAADDLLGAQVNASGIVQARTLDDLKGSLVLQAEGGTISVSGTLDASAPTHGDGGNIETAAAKLQIADSTVVTTLAPQGATGSWRIEPHGFNVAALGGDVSGATLAKHLASTNVTISSPGSDSLGDLRVNDRVTWATDTTLTLEGGRDIDINASLAASGAGSGLNVRAGRDLSLNAPSALGATTLTATAGRDLAFNAPQTWSDAHASSFQASRDINVNDTLAWSIGTVGLDAGGYINLNAAMTAGGTGSLRLTYKEGFDTSVDSNGVPTATYGTPLGGLNPLFDATTRKFVGRIDFANNSATHPLTINGNEYTLITSIGMPTLADGSQNPHDLSVINAHQGLGAYALASDLSAPNAAFAAAPVAVLGGYDSVNGGTGTALPAVLEGLGHDIAGLKVGPGSQGAALGLMGQNFGTVRDLSLTDVNVSGSGGVQRGGSLTGENYGVIAHVVSTGQVNLDNAPAPSGGIASAASIGGLVGINYGLVADVDVAVSVNTLNANRVGGVVGANWGTDIVNAGGYADKRAAIRNAKSTGAVTAVVTDPTMSAVVGGFVGSNFGGAVNASQASGTVTAGTDGTSGASIASLGGFVGRNETNTGAKTSTYGGSIGNSYATGNVVRSGGPVTDAGGFVGTTVGGTMDTSSAFGHVPAASTVTHVGGFAGVTSGTTYTGGNTWSKNLSGAATAVGQGTKPQQLSNSSATAPMSGQGARVSTAASVAAAARTQAQAFSTRASQQQQAAADIASAQAAVDRTNALKAELDAQVAAALQAVAIAQQAAEQATTEGAARVASAQTEANTRAQAAIDAANDAAAKIREAQQRAQDLVNAAQRAAADTTGKYAAEVEAARAAADAAARDADQAIANAAAQAQAAERAAQAAVDAAKQDHDQSAADQAAQLATQKAAGQAAEEEAKRTETQAQADAAGKLAAAQADGAATLQAARDAADQAAKDAAARDAADQAAKDAAARDAADQAAKDAVAKARAERANFASQQGTLQAVLLSRETIATASGKPGGKGGRRAGLESNRILFRTRASSDEAHRLSDLRVKPNAPVGKP